MFLFILLEASTVHKKALQIHTFQFFSAQYSDLCALYYRDPNEKLTWEYIEAIWFQQGAFNNKTLKLHFSYRLRKGFNHFWM